VKRWVNIAESVEITNNRVKPFKGERRYLATGDLIGEEINGSIVSVDYDTKPSRADLLVEEGNIIVARMQATNKVLLIDKNTEDLIVSTGFLTLQPQKEFDGNFLAHYFRSEIFQREKNKYCSGATQKAINNGSFSKLKAPSYPLDEQKRIAIILDHADTLRQKRKQSLQLLDDFLRATFLDMFGDPVNGEKYPRKPLKDVAEVYRGRFSPRPRNDPSYYNGAYPFIQTGDISNSEYRLSRYTQTLNERGIKVSKCLPKGTIAIAIVGATIGATTILEIDAYAPDSVVGITVDGKKASNLYIEYVLRFYKPIFIARAPATARANINLETLRPLLLQIPPLELQNKFALVVDQVERTKLRMRVSLNEMDNQFNALTQRYFE